MCTVVIFVHISTYACNEYVMMADQVSTEKT